LPKPYRNRNGAVRLVWPSGRPRNIGYVEAVRMVRNSEADVLSVDPPVLRIVHTPEHRDELRHARGYVVNRAPLEKLDPWQEKILRRQKRQYRAAGSNKTAKAREYRSRRPRHADAPPTEGARLVVEHKREYNRRRGHEV
jgi:hypothetical protein